MTFILDGLEDAISFVVYFIENHLFNHLKWKWYVTYTKEVVLVVGHNDDGGGGDDDEDGLIDSFDPFRPNPFDFDIILIKIF